MDYSLLFIKVNNQHKEDQLQVMPAMVCVEQKDGTTQLELRTSNANDIMKAMSSKFSQILGNTLKNKLDRINDDEIIEEEAFSDEEAVSPDSSRNMRISPKNGD